MVVGVVATSISSLLAGGSGQAVAVGPCRAALIAELPGSAITSVRVDGRPGGGPSWVVVGSVSTQSGQVTVVRGWSCAALQGADGWHTTITIGG